MGERLRISVVLLSVLLVLGLVPGAASPTAAAPAPLVAGALRGAVDSVSERAAGFEVYGWFWDPTGRTTQVVVERDGVPVGRSDPPYSARPDVAAAVPGAPLATGFSVWVQAAPGTLCLRGSDSQGRSTGTIGCRAAPAPDFGGSPHGVVDDVRPAVGRVEIRGWAADPDAGAPGPGEVPQTHVYLDGQYLSPVPVGVARPDVAAAVPGAGATAGFAAVLPARPGRHQVCVYAINRGRTGRNTTLGCRTVDVPSRAGAPLPLGSLDGQYAVSALPNAVGAGIRGWAARRDGAPVTVRALAVGGFLGNPEKVFDVTGTTGVPRPDVPTVVPGLPGNTGYDIPLGGGRSFQYRIVCAVAQSPGAEVLLGCLSPPRLDGRHF